MFFTLSMWGAPEGGPLPRRGPGLAPAGDSLFFVSPKKSKQKKGDPTVRDPQQSCGQPALLAKRGQAANSLRSNMRPADPRFAALLGTPRGGPGTRGQRAMARPSGLCRLLAVPRAERSDGPSHA